MDGVHPRLPPTVLQTLRLKDNLRSIDKEKQQTEQYLEEAILAGERLRDHRDSAKLSVLQKSHEVESLSREVSRLIKKSFAKGNEIVDLKEQCEERQAEIERLNEVITLFRYFSLFLTRSEAP